MEDVKIRQEVVAVAVADLVCVVDADSVHHEEQQLQIHNRQPQTVHE